MSGPRKGQGDRCGRAAWRTSLLAAALVVEVVLAGLGAGSASHGHAAPAFLPQVTATPITIPPLAFTWATPAAITYGTPLGGLQLNATVTAGGMPIPGFITYSPPAGTVLHAGANQQLLATFVPGLSEFHDATTGVMIAVNPAATTLILRANPTTPVNGQPVTLTAVISTTVTGVGLPAGTVTFAQGGSALGAPVPLTDGTATFVLDSFSPGAGNLSAVYTPSLNFLGNPDFSSSQAGLGVAMGQEATTIVLQVTNSTSNVGQSVTFTARVTGTGAGQTVPTGTVSFLDVGGTAPTVLALAPLDNLGRASLSESGFQPGGHRVLAVYVGDQHYQGSQSAVLVQLVRSCAVEANLGQVGPLSLDLVTGAALPAGNHFTFLDGKTKVMVSDPVVTYCANPGRSNEQAVVTGTVAARAGRFRKGDQIGVTLRTLGTSHAPMAIVEDAAIRQRLVLLGPFNLGSVLKISTI